MPVVILLAFLLCLFTSLYKYIHPLLFRKRGPVWVSWNKNIAHPCDRIHHPTSEEEIAKIVRSAKTVRVIGKGFSSSDIIGGGISDLISLKYFRRILRIDPDALTVTAQAGVTLSELLPQLASAGLCLGCLPDIDALTLGGAIATGAHGTGKHGLSLSGLLVGCHVILADGSSLVLKEGDHLLDAFRVSAGMLGIMTVVTLRCEPLFFLQIREHAIADAEWLPALPSLLAANDFLRVQWLPHSGFAYVTQGVRQSTSSLPRTRDPWYMSYRRSVSQFLYFFCTYFPSGVPLCNKLIHRLFFSGTSTRFGSLYDVTVTKSRSTTMELMEFSISLDKFPHLFTELKEEFERTHSYAQIPMDIRFMRADSGWLSNGKSAGEIIVTMGCVTRIPWAASRYRPFTVMERVFTSHGGRPHIAKRFQCDREELRGLFDRMDEFVDLRRRLDPNGKFLNRFLRNLFS